MRGDAMVGAAEAGWEGWALLGAANLGILEDPLEWYAWLIFDCTGGGRLTVGAAFPETGIPYSSTATVEVGGGTCAPGAGAVGGRKAPLAPTPTLTPGAPMFYVQMERER